VKALLDTNILIDYLNGIEPARQEIERYDSLLISPITWMEVMAGASDEEQATIRSFLSRFIQIPINAEIAELAVVIRKEKRIRLPDAIIWASAKSENALLVSRNVKDFPENEPGVRVPYGA
jgi:predicted nucleic acid-binding protein